MEYLDGEKWLDLADGDYKMWSSMHSSSEDLRKGRDSADGSSTGIKVQSRTDF